MVGVLIFIDDGHTKKPKVQSGIVTIYMMPSLLGPTLDVLRNEKPLQLWVSSGGNWGMLKTGNKEPVGEEET